MVYCKLLSCYVPGWKENKGNNKLIGERKTIFNAPERTDDQEMFSLWWSEDISGDCTLYWRRNVGDTTRMPNEGDGRTKSCWKSGWCNLDSKWVMENRVKSQTPTHEGDRSTVDYAEARFPLDTSSGWGYSHSVDMFTWMKMRGPESRIPVKSWFAEERTNGFLHGIVGGTTENIYGRWRR